MTLPWATEKPRTHLGELLTGARVRNQIPLYILGEAVGITEHACSRLLNFACPKLSTALKLGRALGLKDSSVVQAWVLDRVAAEGLDLKITVKEG